MGIGPVMADRVSMALCQEADVRRNHEFFNGRNAARTPLSTVGHNRSARSQNVELRGWLVTDPIPAARACAGWPAYRPKQIIAGESPYVSAASTSQPAQTLTTADGTKYHAIDGASHASSVVAEYIEAV